MIAAVAAVVAGGAFAKACDYEPTTPDVAWAYTWKFTGKTTDGVKVGNTKSKSSPCDLGGGSSSESACNAIRVPASLKIQGYTAYCAPGCGSDGFEVLGEVQEVFWQTKPRKLSLSGGVTTEVSNIIGKKAKQYEIAGIATFDGEKDSAGALIPVKYDIVFAGLGKFDTKNKRVSSASGNFAGTLEYPQYLEKDACTSEYAGIWECANLTLFCSEVDSVAFGKWNVKFNKKAAKKLLTKANNVVEAVKIPGWVDKNLNGREGF